MNKNIIPDSLLISNTLKDALKIVSKDQQNSASNHLAGLPYQGLSIKSVIDNIEKKNITQWAKMTESLPGHLYNFVRKAIQSQLPTLANLVRWGKMSSNLCPLCNSTQTNKHVLSNCSNPGVLDRYLGRHNMVLTLLGNWFKSILKNGFTLFVDLPGACFKQTQDLFVGVRPDMAIMTDADILVIELTICHETNFESSRNYKINKYENISNHKTQLIKNHKVSLTTIELSVLGFLQLDSNCWSKFGFPVIDEATILNLSRTVISSSFEIYAQRDTPNM